MRLKIEGFRLAADGRLPSGPRNQKAIDEFFLNPAISVFSEAR
jgi:hypothetical protein